MWPPEHVQCWFQRREPTIFEVMAKHLEGGSLPGFVDVYDMRAKG